MIGHAKSSFLIGWPLLVVLVAPSATLAADFSTDHASPSIAAQPNDPGTAATNRDSLLTARRREGFPARQPGESTTLEVAPQPSDKVPAPDKDETAEQRAFRQSRQDEIARLNRNFHPHDVEDSHRRPTWESISNTRRSAISAWRSMDSKS